MFHPWFGIPDLGPDKARSNLINAQLQLTQVPGSQIWLYLIRMFHPWFGIPDLGPDRARSNLINAQLQLTQVPGSQIWPQLARKFHPWFEIPDLVPAWAKLKCLYRALFSLRGSAIFNIFLFWVQTFHILFYVFYLYLEIFWGFLKVAAPLCN